jgi:hypothetical protein
MPLYLHETENEQAVCRARASERAQTVRTKDEKTPRCLGAGSMTDGLAGGSMDAKSQDE